MRQSLVSLFVLGVLLAWAGEASAHATPLEYRPEASVVLERAPAAVTIRFSERIEPKASGITVFAPDGSRADAGNPFVDASDPRVFSVLVKENREGTYSVSWQVVSSDDGHFTKGAFGFSVGKETASAAAAGGQFQVQHLTTVPQAAAVGLELLGAALLLGALLSLWFLARPLSLPADRLAPLVALGALAAVAGVAWFIALKSLGLASLRGSGFFDGFSTFLQTTDGSYAAARAALGILFAGVFFAFRRRIFAGARTSLVEWVLFALLLAAIVMRARVSHAAASLFLPEFSIFVNAVHLFFKELWAGLLAAVVFAFVPHAPALMGRLSRLLAGAFAGVGVTGAYIVWLHLKDPAYLWESEWGSRFIVLFIFAGALVLMRLYHHFTGARALARSGATLAFEWLMAVAVIFVSSLLIITTPPHPPEHFTFEKRAHSQGAQIVLSVHPFDPAQFLITVTDSTTRTEIPLKGMTIALTNAEKSIGPIVAQVKKRFEGGYAFSRSELAPPGTWEVAVAAQRESAYDAVASFSVAYPDEVVSTVVTPSRRAADGFTWFLLVCALFIAAFSFFLRRYPARAPDASAVPPRRAGRVPAAAAFVLFVLFAWASHELFIKTDFQKLCQANGHMWMQAPPMREGTALSADTVLGCMPALSEHIADFREYQYFLRPVQAEASFAVSPLVPVTHEPAQMTVTIAPHEGIVTEHERPTHMVIISEDMETFDHIHPIDNAAGGDAAGRATGVFTFEHVFHEAGRYLVVVDYAVRWKPFSKRFFVDVVGEPKMAPPAVPDFARSREWGTYGAALTAVPGDIRAGVPATLAYTFTRNGKPLTDLEPYLGAPLHLAVFRSDMSESLHTHGELPLPWWEFWKKQGAHELHAALPSAFGPHIVARTVFPSPGTYYLFAEYRHAGKTMLAPFAVEVGK